MRSPPRSRNASISTSGKTGNTATLGIEYLDPQEALDLATEMELAQIGAMSWEWYDLPASEKRRAKAGHTKKLKSPAMLATEGLRVALATTHVPLHEVSDRITAPLLERVLRILHGALQRDFGIASPRIGPFRSWWRTGTSPGSSMTLPTRQSG